jgi:hypothetical protein
MINRFGLNRTVPKHVEIQVRSECGYGCAFCGEIFVELHHFEPTFADAIAHKPEGIITLCEKHHKMAGNGEIPISEIRNARLNPISKQLGYVSQDIFTVKSDPVIVFGSNHYSARNFILFIDTIPTIWTSFLADGRLAISAIFRDQEFYPIVAIRENIIVKNIDSIAIRKVSNRYIVGDERNPSLVISFSEGRVMRIEEIKAFGLYSSIEVKDGMMYTGGDRFLNNLAFGSKAIFGYHPRPIMDRFESSRYSQRVVSATGELVGFRQDDLLFDVDGALCSKICGDEVRRVFLNKNDNIVEGHTTGIVKEGMIFRVPFQNNTDLPLVPVPTGAFEFVQATSVNGEILNMYCTSRFHCSRHVPRFTEDARAYLL